MKNVKNDGRGLPLVKSQAEAESDTPLSMGVFMFFKLYKNGSINHGGTNCSNLEMEPEYLTKSDV